MIWELLFWSGIVLSLAIGAVYFRDLGDVTQMANANAMVRKDPA